MDMIEGYSIQEEIHRGRRRVVCRAVREADNTQVIIKSVSADISTEEDFAELKREFEILSDLRVDGVVKVQELISHSGTVHLVLEDRGAVTLAERLRANTITLADRLRIAINITNVLSEIHNNGVLHKDINPINILIDPSNGDVTVIDFSISTRQAEEHQPVTHPIVLEGTLAYLSPEQTGRMNRPVEYRSDFYSLGVTLFELFTGQLPFQADDPMELVHCHMAVPAPSPGDICKELPSSLCMVILKLMEKAPEDRYQSAAGILHDLKECLEHIQSGIKPKEFHPGQHEVPDRFLIPKKLYGRQDELATILQAFDRIRRHGSEFMLVAGYSGIGKSALIHALQSPITKRRGYFVFGKFDQLQRTVPYSAIVVALSDLVRQLLTETDESLAEWKYKLQEAVGNNGQLIIDVIPEVEYVIGAQSKVPDQGGQEAKNRFLMVFRNFVRVFCQRAHPLVLFLDDLQWADPASLDIVETILTDEETQHLLLIGAYRDNEVDDSHPLVGTIETLQSSGAAVSELSLGPLNTSTVEHLLADTLHCDNDELQSLLTLLIEKTGGNPFFLRQFLKTLHQNHKLTFDRLRQCWTWDIAAINAMNITDNVVDLMVRRLKELPEGTQSALSLAACIGSSIDLAALGTITADRAGDVLADITPAIEAGLIVPIHKISKPAGAHECVVDNSSHVRFLHDRVQQAAYSLIDESSKRHTHLRIGQQLLSKLQRDSQDEKLFEIADHLNLGRELIAAESERCELADLNHRAARKAIGAAAYAAARDYAVAGLSCLSESRWSSNYELTRDLNHIEAEAEYLRGDFERSQEIISAMLLKLSTPVERAELHNTLLIQQTLSGQYREAIETGREGLTLLGVDLPSKELDQALEHELTRYREALNTRLPAELLEMGEMHSPEMLVAMQLLASLCPLGYINNPSLCRLASTLMVNISLQYGNTPPSAIGYAFFGQMHSSVFHDYETAYGFGRLAMALADKFGDLSQICRTSHVFCAFINHWSRPLQEFDEINIRGFQAGLQSGELQYAGYHRYNRALCLFHQGMRLKELLPETDEWMRFGSRTRNEHVTDQVMALRRVGMDLCGETTDLASFVHAGDDDKRFLEDLRSRNALPALCHYNIIKSQALFLYGRHKDALRCADEAAGCISFIPGHMSVAVHNFYESMILVASTNGELRKPISGRIEKNQSLMRKWAESCPDNFLHKCLLVDAEVARLEDQHWRAAELYDRAIMEAARAGYLQEESLARERAGLFWLTKGLKKIAALYLSEAHHGYQLWGASRKAQLLTEQHADLLAGTTAPMEPPRANSLPFFTLVSSSGAALDYATVIKASHAISREIDLDALVKKLLRIAVETAGAQRGQLLLARKDGLYVEATSTVDTGETRCSPALHVDASQDLPPTIINYVTRTKETLTIADASKDPLFAGDAVIQRLRPRSILCVPVLMRAEMLGLLYLEHNDAPNTFTSDRVQILQSLAAQAAISLQNTRLFEQRKHTEDQLREAVAELEELKNRLEAENEYFKEEIKTHHKFEEIIGQSEGVTKMLQAIETVAPTDATALILGETGTGKELVARAIHSISSRNTHNIVIVNCAALPAGLVESELFGHEKGAFTGALSQKIGRFELADKSTLFLDEIGDLPLELQVKLLRVLQDGTFERVGGTQTISVDVRVIAATHRDLLEAVKEQAFREDLYYRLNVFPIHIPPLRERKEDIPLLVKHFVMRYSTKMGKNIESIPKTTMSAMTRYLWPGNIRELQNVIERAVILCLGTKLEMGDWIPQQSSQPGKIAVRTLDEQERQHITEVLEMTGWRVSGERGAAKILGLKSTTLEARMKKLGLNRPD